MGMPCSSGEILSPVATQRGHSVPQLCPNGPPTHRMPPRHLSYVGKVVYFQGFLTSHQCQPLKALACCKPA